MDSKKKKIRRSVFTSINGIVFLFVIICSLVYFDPFYSSNSSQEVDNEAPLFDTLAFLPLSRDGTASTVNVYLLSINQTHTYRGNNVTFTGYVQNITGNVIDFGPPLILEYANESGIEVFPVINGHALDGNDPDLITYPNLTIKSSFINGFEGQFSFSYLIPNDYDISVDMIINVNCSKNQEDEWIFFNQDSIMNSSFIHDITLTTSIDIDTLIVSPLYDGNQFHVNYTITDNNGDTLGVAINENITVYRNNTLTDELILTTDYTIDYATRNVTVAYTRGTTDIGLHFNGYDETITDGETYYQYSACNASTIVEYLTTRIFLLDVNQTHTIRGNSFTFTGYTQKLSNNVFENTSGIQVYPIIDDVHYDVNNVDDRSIPSGLGGLFSFSVDVASDHIVANDIIVWANITEDIGANNIVGQDTIANSPLSHDITSLTTLSIIIDNSVPKLTGDIFDLEVTLTDDLGESFTIPTDRFELYRNLNLSSLIEQVGITIDALDADVLIQEITQENGMGFIGVNFTGVPTLNLGQTYLEYESCNASVSIRRVQAINGTFSFSNALKNTTLPYVFTQGDVLLTGTLSMDENFTVISQPIEVFLNGVSIGTAVTNATGYFEFEFNLEDKGFLANTSVEACAITIQLRNMDSEYVSSNTSTSINTITLEIQDDNPYITPPNTDEFAGDVEQDWLSIILVGAGVAVLVVGVIIFQRKRMDLSSQRDRKLRKVDYTRFISINILYNEGRRREAIAYSYKIFSDLINEKYGLVREEAETIREFAIKCVTKYGLDPMRTYPYLALVENIVYGFYDLNPEAFEKAIQIFGRVFHEITGTNLDFTLIQPPEGSDEGVTIRIGAVSE